VEKITRYYSVKDGLEKELSNKPLCVVIGSIINELVFDDVHGVMVTCDCDETIKFVADWDLLKESLGYVIDNAYKNTHEKGVVTINCWKDASDVYIHVSNEGAAIEPSLAERVFDGLFIPDLLHHRQGTGLSLAIAKEIIEEHNGRISCSNLDNRGTLYEIAFKEVIK
jgi:K+-sensing histidine kinase KdpD